MCLVTVKNQLQVYLLLKQALWQLDLLLFELVPVCVRSMFLQLLSQLMQESQLLLH